MKYIYSYALKTQSQDSGLTRWQANIDHFGECVGKKKKERKQTNDTHKTKPWSFWEYNNKKQTKQNKKNNKTKKAKHKKTGKHGKSKLEGVIKMKKMYENTWTTLLKSIMPEVQTLAKRC